MKKYLLLFFLAIVVHGVILAQCPFPHVLSGLSGTRCEDGPAKAISVYSTEVGVSYQLQLNYSNYGAPKPGTGSKITFEGIVTAGTYDVVATHLTSGCANYLPWQDGRNQLVVGALPLDFLVSVEGNSSFCADQTGTVKLSGSQSEVWYLLFRNGNSTGQYQFGTGQSISFSVSQTGIYTVLANGPGPTSCSRTMSQQASINVTPMPIQYVLSGYPQIVCPGGTTTITLAGSQAGVNYQLKRDGINVGQPVVKSGGQITWNSQPPGVYTVTGTTLNGMCGRQMANAVTISSVPSPAEFTLTGSAVLCPGASAILSGSEPGKSYRLSADGLHMPAVAGTGNAIIWNNLTRSGPYLVDVLYPRGDGAICTTTFSSQIEINYLTAFQTMGTGYLCPGVQGLPVTLSNSQPGVQYQLKLDGQSDGPSVPGTGSVITWANKPVGSYSVEATYPELGCSKPMLNTATITAVAINDYAVSLQHTGLNCGQNLIKLNNSQNYVTYRVKRADNYDSNFPELPGSNAPLQWAGLYASGDYKIEAHHTQSGCRVNMPGSVTVSCDFDNLIALQNLGIAADTVPHEYILGVGGKILTAGINLKVPSLWPDYVFDSRYKLRTIDEVDMLIQSNGHLPGIPSATEMKDKGHYRVNGMDAKLLEKIEELTLYAIQIDDQVNKVTQEAGKRGNVVIGKESSDTQPVKAQASFDFNIAENEVFQSSSVPSSENFSADVTIKQSLSIGSAKSIPEGFKLMVQGNILAAGLDIKPTANWPDYVFSDNYNLLPLEKVKDFIAQHGHLPGVPSADELKALEFYSCAEMDSRLLEKIEELTLHVIELKQRLDGGRSKSSRFDAGFTQNRTENGNILSNGLSPDSSMFVAQSNYSVLKNENATWESKVSPGEMESFALPLTAISTLEVVSVSENVSIGTNRTVPNYKLVVAGNIIATGANFKPPHKWPDYVFKPGYQRMCLQDLKHFIERNGHLPNLKSAAEMYEQGDYNLAEMDGNLLEKIEELTLYLIEMNDKINEIQNSDK